MKLSWSTNFPTYSTISQFAYSSIFPWLLITSHIVGSIQLSFSDQNCIGGDDGQNCGGDDDSGVVSVHLAPVHHCELIT